MTDRTCLDVAADAICTNTGRCFVGETHRIQAETALDAIHPALADLTPDDVAELIELWQIDFPGSVIAEKIEKAVSRD